MYCAFFFFSDEDSFVLYSDVHWLVVWVIFVRVLWSRTVMYCSVYMPVE